MYAYDSNGQKVPIVEKYTPVRENFGSNQVERYSTDQAKNVGKWVLIVVGIMIVLAIAVMVGRRYMNSKDKPVFGCGMDSSSSSTMGGQYGFRFY